MTWNDITLKQYNDIQKIINSDADEMAKMSSLVAVLYNLNMDEVPMTEAIALQAEGVEFLNSIPKVGDTILKKQYTIKGIKYVPTPIDKMTMSQYMDYQAYAKLDEEHLINTLSVCLVPKGHKYNDGSYDIEELKNELHNMSVMDALRILSFFQNRSSKYIVRSLYCLTKDLMNTKGLTLKQKITLAKTFPTMI